MLDAHAARRAFARAARDYEQHDALQRQAEERLIDSLDYYEQTPERILDVGCGTARGTALLRRRWPKATVIALDWVMPMLQRARRHLGWRHPIQRVCADARRLPVPDHSIDILYSNLCMQWCGPSRELFREFARVLTPGGFLVASSLGPDTLMELNAACAAAGGRLPQFGQFVDMHDVGDAALASGLKDPVLDSDHITLEYPEVRTLLAELKGQGMTNTDRERGRGLTGKARLRALLDAYATRSNGQIAATWELVTMHAWGMPEGAMPLYGGRETRFEVIRRREPRPPR